MKSFHVPMKVKMARVTRIGLQAGRTSRPVDAELARAVDACRVEQAVGDRQRVLPDQEDAEDARHAGDDHPRVGVDQAHLLEHQEERQHRHLRRDDQRAEQDPEETVASRKAQLGEGIAGHRVEDQGDDRHRRCDQGAVEDVAGEIEAGEQGAVVLEGDRGWAAGGADSAVASPLGISDAETIHRAAAGSAAPPPRARRAAQLP